MLKLIDLLGAINPGSTIYFNVFDNPGWNPIVIGNTWDAALNYAIDNKNCYVIEVRADDKNKVYIECYLKKKED